MRRIAKDSRNDNYGSRKDYQVFIPVATTRIDFDRDCPTLVYRPTKDSHPTGFMGFGAYMKTNCPVEMVIRVTSVDGGVLTERAFSLTTHWSRVGLVFNATRQAESVVHLHFTSPVNTVWVWGADCDLVTVPSFNEMLPIGDNLDLIDSASLAPETFYLTHDDNPSVTLVKEASFGVADYVVDETAPINLKKCPYCNRLLPVDPVRLGSLAFHKHMAKRTHHQNECRACKKWRINDSFNPRRSKDQLHESSVITRERKIFLRENEILQVIKNRHSGEGLKTIVWNRFGHRCFNCGTALTEDEVRLDHTRPLAYLWPLDEHATCLCEGCNNRKHDQFPVDFYGPEKLKALATIVGLPIGELSKKEANGRELDRIIANIADFANMWDPRTFRSIAYKVLSVRPEIDLFDILCNADINTYIKLLRRLRRRAE